MASDIIPYFSLVVPVYKNAESITSLVSRLKNFNEYFNESFETILVIDGSPDESAVRLAKQLAETRIQARIIQHSRNFGSFSAIVTGMRVSNGETVGIMAADLQEPSTFYFDAAAVLRNSSADVVIGRRISRNDPLPVRLTSKLFWSLYVRYVQKDMPRGGIDIFVVRRKVALKLVGIQESHTSLVGLLIWLGYERVVLPYVRSERTAGKSTWSIKKRLRYATDSLFSFSSFPVTAISIFGGFLCFVSFPITILRLVVYVFGQTDASFDSIMMLGLISIASFLVLSVGLIGEYVWRTYENSKGRPEAVISTVIYPGDKPQDGK